MTGRVGAALMGLLLAATPAAGQTAPALAGPVAGAAATASDGPVGAAGQAAAMAPGDSLRVYLLTFGPGSAVWERFGHNAIWIHDPEAGTDVAYHWGLFDMSEEGFMVEFLQGRMVYSMGAADRDRLMNAYRRAGRSATIQELALTVEQAESLQEFVRWNIRPENRQYRYDYFRDNCSTRVRDALDDALGGTLRRVLTDRGTVHTYRSQAVALTAEDVVLTSSMDLGLGPLADQPIARWELAYIPMRLRDDLRTVTVERGGGQLPLVTSERGLAPLDGADPSVSAPPSSGARVLGHLIAGLLLGVVVVGTGALTLRAAGRVRAGARWLLAVLGGLWGLLAGALGTVLLGLWLLTDHEFAWRNENLLQTNPLALGLALLVPLAVLRGRATAAARSLGLTLLGLSLIGLLIHPLPVTLQANLPIIAAVLPVHLAFGYALHRLHRAGAPDH